MAERVGIRSYAYALPLRGPAPSCLPTQGSPSPAIPPCSNPTTSAGNGHSTRTPSQSYFALSMAERVGFEPTVPLPRRMLSKHVDSSTLAPLRDRTTSKGGILSRRPVSGKVRDATSLPSDSISKRHGGETTTGVFHRDVVRGKADLPPLTDFARIPILRDHFSGGT